MRRVTKPGGRVFAATHEPPAQTWPVEEQPRDFDKMVKLILGGWQSKTMPQLFERAGFTDIGLKIEFDRFIASCSVNSLQPIAATPRR